MCGGVWFCVRGLCVVLCVCSGVQEMFRWLSSAPPDVLHVWRLCVVQTVDQETLAPADVVHVCEALCHEGPCGPCSLSSSIRCRCGSKTKVSQVIILLPRAAC